MVLSAAEAVMFVGEMGVKVYRVRQGLLARRSIEIAPFFVINVSYYELTKYEDSQSHFETAIKSLKHGHGQLKHGDMAFHYQIQWHEEFEESIGEESDIEEELEDEDTLPAFYVSGFNLYVVPNSSKKLREIILNANAMMTSLERELRAYPSVKVRYVDKQICLRGKYDELGQIYQKLVKKLKGGKIDSHHDLQRVPDGLGMIVLSLSSSENAEILSKVVG
jgi:hypothetical protein